MSTNVAFVVVRYFQVNVTELEPAVHHPDVFVFISDSIEAHKRRRVESVAGLMRSPLVGSAPISIMNLVPSNFPSIAANDKTVFP